MLEIRLGNLVSHSEVLSSLVAVKRKLIIHYEFKKNSYKPSLNEISCYLVMRLGEILKEHEKVIKVSPIDFSLVNDPVNE